MGATELHKLAYLIEGGAPAGNSNPPGFEGCRTTRTSIKIITMHGNRRTTPSGIDIFEFPRNRIRLRKNANLAVQFSLSHDISPKEGSFSREVRLGEEGIRLAIF
jgi:hypothetical protein